MSAILEHQVFELALEAGRAKELTKIVDALVDRARLSGTAIERVAALKALELLGCLLLGATSMTIGGTRYEETK